MKKFIESISLSDFSLFFQVLIGLLLIVIGICIGIVSVEHGFFKTNSTSSSSSYVEFSSSSEMTNVEIPEKCSVDTATNIWLDVMDNPSFKNCKASTVMLKQFNSTDIQILCPTPRKVKNNLKHFKRLSMDITDNKMYVTYTCDWTENNKKGEKQNGNCTYNFCNYWYSWYRS